MENKVEFKKSAIYTEKDFRNDVQEMFGKLKVEVKINGKNFGIEYATKSKYSNSTIMSVVDGMLDFQKVGYDFGLKIYQLWKKIGNEK